VKLKKAIFLFVVVILSLTSFSFRKDKSQLELIEIQASTTPKNATCDFIKNITNSVELELDEEQEEQEDNSIVYSNDFISSNTFVRAPFKFNFQLQSYSFPQRNLLYIIFLKILI
jgi:hypothetical protein